MPNHQITWEDAQQMPDDGVRYEAIGGELIVTPAPNLRHQDIVLRLALQLQAILVEPGHGRLWISPVGVEFPATLEGVQPDLVFVSNERRGIIADLTLKGPPDLVIEVLSPGTTRRDRGLKHRLYARRGVAQYWIVDPEADALEVHRFGEDPAFERFTDRVPVRIGAAGAGVLGEVDLATVFRRD
ncbi:MAG TPA: Uma2 family endonuclease [Gemmatimonadota bacterium]|nr:Uma2 family endonuclease [Gemmatimonadota bacterium]